MTTTPGVTTYRFPVTGSVAGVPAIALWRAFILLTLFSIIFLPEFARDGAGPTGLSVYAKVAAGFRFVDLVILFAGFCHLVAHGCLRHSALRFPRPLVWPGVGFLACIGIAAYYGSTRGGSNMFFDWRGLALGIALYLVWSFWLQTSADVAAAVRVFAIYLGARVALLYVLYVAGYRDHLLGVDIPIYDGPVLSCIVFASLLAWSYQESTVNLLEKLSWRCLALAAYLMVFLCFRRTYWGELAVGTFILLLLPSRHRLRNLALVAGMLAVAACLMGASFSRRMQSLVVTSDDTEFSADNADHLYDLMDAWSEVRQSPVMGIGLGTSYHSWHIRNWKSESVMVHNAPLHVWLKYGIAGLLCYLWFHVALLRWLYRQVKAPRTRNHAFVSAAFAYLTAQFVLTLGFAPWPYSELQLTTLISFILAAVVAAGVESPRLSCL
jgi:hypothetical protein